MHKKQIKALVITFLFLIAGLLYSISCSQDIFISGSKSNNIMWETEETKNNKSETLKDEKNVLPETDTSKFYVHVCGAVKKAGVYELSNNSIVRDAIEAAGGMSKDAACDYLNLAEKLKEGDKIYIPTKAEIKKGSIFNTETDSNIKNDTDKAGSKDNDTLIDINKADAEELTSLPGIGKTRAEAIIAYRNKNGNFKSIEDIMSVSGIKEGYFEKFKNMIKV